MRYVVRTPDGELVYPSLLDVEQAYLQGLATSSAAAALTAPGGFGDFLWAVKRVG